MDKRKHIDKRGLPCATEGCRGKITHHRALHCNACAVKARLGRIRHTPDPGADVLTPQDTAALLKISVATVYQRRKELGFRKIGAAMRTTRAAIMQFLSGE